MIALKPWRSAYAVGSSSFRRKNPLGINTPKVGRKNTAMSCVAKGHLCVTLPSPLIETQPGAIHCKGYFLRFQVAGQGRPFC